MGKNWDFAEHSKKVSGYGGVIPYEAHMERTNFQKGVKAMVPVCVGCVGVGVFIGKKWNAVANYFKNKLGTEPRHTEDKEQQFHLEEQDEALEECPICKRKAYTFDEVSVLFGFMKNDNGTLVPYDCCKRCRTQNRKESVSDNMW